MAPRQEVRFSNDQGGSCGGCKETLLFFTKFVLIRCLGFSLYILDVLSDVNAAYGDYRAGDEIYAYITLGLVFAPGILFSLYMFCEYFMKYVGEFACLKAPLWVLVSPLLPVWVILRGLKQIIEGIIATIIPSRRDKLKEKCSEPSKVYLIKFIEAFVESAPQLLVRLFRVATRSQTQFADMRTSEIIQICFSLFQLSMKVVSTHQQSVSTQQVLNGEAEHDSNLTLPWYLQLIAIAWWLCFLTSRLEALALFSASYGYWVLLVVGIHVLLMFMFMTIADHKDRLKRIFNYLFGAFVFIFAYVQFNLKARIKIAVWFPYTVFSVVLFVENSVMLTFWYFDQRRSLGEVSPLASSNATWEHSPLAYSNATTEIAPEEIGVEDLQHHWKLLLFIHYGLFGAGLLLMAAVFCCASFCSDSQDLDSEKDKVEETSNQEMRNLMS